MSGCQNGTGFAPNFTFAILHWLQALRSFADSAFTRPDLLPITSDCPFQMDLSSVPGWLCGHSSGLKCSNDRTESRGKSGRRGISTSSGCAANAAGERQHQEESKQR
jgi:hypothetical protein